MPFASPPLRRPRSGSIGFTLIELVVVMVVIAALTATVAVGIGNIRGASIQSEAGKLAIGVRYLYNMSVLHGKVYRLTIDIDGASWWGEAQASRDPCKSFELPGEDNLDDPEATPKEKAELAKEDAEASGKRPTASFGVAKTRLLKKRKLDKGIRFAGVMTSHQSQLAEHGQAYIYFFPNGTSERAVVFIRNKDDEDDVMTVEVLPLQGSARIHNDELDIGGFFDGDGR